ncbi:MAG: hypothetical protein CVU38_10570 [Chloroflexi bacterium HGW-Chloroflexi-1]|nr:MAG: hypothetical protein CVU38_10570 [Chloroflexi bacterium HGW-Chloroflexi-1]
MQLICEGHPQISSLSEGLLVVLNHPTVLDQPVLQGGSDADASGASIYGSVMRDGGVFRMWYQAWPRDWDGTDTVAVGCVESDDGLSWRRPNYGLIECCGARKNQLTDLPFHCPSVMIDPDAEPSARYRAFGYADPGKLGNKYAYKVNESGYYTAHSADGLHWVLDSPEPLWPYADVITSVWDSPSGCARIAMKKTHRIRGLGRRAFLTATWSQGVASEPVSALIPDEYDDIMAQQRGFNSADYYGVGLMPTAGPTIGFLWNFRHQLPLGYYQPETMRHGDIGRVDLSIVYQTERGGRWRPVPGRPDWLSANDAPDWARGALYTAAYPLDVGDETWLYFCGTRDRHGWCGHGIDHTAMTQAATTEGGSIKIGLARWPRNRIMGYESTLVDVISLLPGQPTQPGGRLALNVVTCPGGTVRARLLDANGKALSGYGFEDCQVITGDHLEAMVRWRGKPNLPGVTPRQSIMAQIELSRATLYAFDFQLAK